MGFLMFLAVPGLVLSSFLLTFALAGAWEAGERAGARGVGTTLIGQIIVLICTALILINPSVIQPLWLQYLLLIGVPAVAGFVTRRVLARSLSEQ